MKTHKALIKTKSNYRGLNGQWLDVKQFLGTLVACIFKDEEGDERTVDFSLTEIVSIKEKR